MDEISELSDREIEILKLVATGLSNKEIAYQLKISPNTVKVHLKNIFSKIGVVSRTEAAMFAVRQGWVIAGNQVAVEMMENEEKSGVSGVVQSAFSPLVLSLFGMGGFALMILLVILFVNLAGRNTPQVIEIVVTPTPEPVRWELVTQMPEPKKSMAYAAVDNKIYIIGGETPEGVSDRVDIYDTVTGQWSEGARKPTPVSEACGAYLGGKIIVAGGKMADGTVTNVVEAYDVAEDRWEQLPELPNPLAGAGCVEYGEDLYLFGGINKNKVYSSVILYSFFEKTGIEKYELSIPRTYFALSVINDQIFLVGGWDGTREIKVITTISINGGRIYENNNYDTIGEGRYYLTSQNILDKIYIVGGVNESLNVINSFELDPITKRKRLVENPKHAPWCAHGAVYFGEYLYGFGGELGGLLTSEMYRLRVIYTIVLPLLGQ